MQSVKTIAVTPVFESSVLNGESSEIVSVSPTLPVEPLVNTTLAKSKGIGIVGLIVILVFGIWVVKSMSSRSRH